MRLTVSRVVSVVSLFVLGFSCRTASPKGGFVKSTEPDGTQFSSLQLRMEGNPTTGSIVARFAYATTEFVPGQTVNLAYDIVSNGSGKVLCSKLKRRAMVQLEGQGKEGFFRINVSPEVFLGPIRPHPKGEAKFDTTREDAIYNGPMQIEGCLLREDGQILVKAGAEVGKNGQAMGLDDTARGIVDYGRICAKKLGALPAFSCLDDNLFKEIVVKATVDGTASPITERTEKCDNPIYLPTGDGGSCKPWARMGKIKTSATAYAAVICRRYWPETSNKANANGAGSGLPSTSDTDPNASTGNDSWKRNPSSAADPYFNDVAVIQYDPASGDACFFQALGTLNVERVPPPDEVELPADVATQFPKAKNAKSFWLAPAGTANINCINCHDADPWMHSPYARSAKDAGGRVWLSSAPNRPKYNMLGGEFGFSDWTKSYTIRPKDGSGDACLACHKAGSLNGCSSWFPDVGNGSHHAAYKTDFAKSFPQTHWMPPDHGEDLANWDSNYKSARDAIVRCCNIPGAELGLRKASWGFDVFGGQARYGKTLTDAQLQILDQAGCEVKPRSSVVTGTGAH